MLRFDPTNLCLCIIYICLELIKTVDLLKKKNLLKISSYFLKRDPGNRIDKDNFREEMYYGDFFPGVMDQLLIFVNKVSSICLALFEEFKYDITSTF